jgi:predicted metalloprotease
MRWKGRRQSTNVEDRRWSTGRKVGLGGGGLLTIAVALIFLLTGGDPGDVMNQLQFDTGTSLQTDRQHLPTDDEMSRFISVVLADTEDVWNNIFRASGRSYREPKLVLYRSQIQSACGFSSAASGPFYCPGDEKIYIDLDFLEQILRRFDVSGDFAVAYIVAHEVGHHVQNLLGIMDRMPRGRFGGGREFNEMMVRLELQADFLAGVWVNHIQRMSGVLEEGDMEEAMNAVSAVGDDTIQKHTQGYVVPDSFTHGTSSQRLRWFMKGVRTGDPSQGDTFSADVL